MLGNWFSKGKGYTTARCVSQYSTTNETKGIDLFYM